jgi:uncharacterized protein (TIGR02453 family)
MSSFPGFEPAACTFLRDLAAHNDRAWFHAHEAEYRSLLLEPARGFVVAMGERLAKVVPGINADPRVNGSILRIARDTRFSADKRPYRSHLDMWFWEGEGLSRERSGFFMRLDADTVTLGAGMHHFEGPVLAEYRRAVADSDRGAALDRAVRKARLAGAQFGPARWKRVPAPHPADHPRADLLRQGGLVAATTDPLPAEAFTAEFPRWCAERLRPVRPLQAWVATVVAAAPAA